MSGQQPPPPPLPHTHARPSGQARTSNISLRSCTGRRAAWAAAAAAAARKRAVRKLPMAAGEHGEGSMGKRAWEGWQ
eukprot:1160883-Pelagomonas_calceolata.AAC.11